MTALLVAFVVGVQQPDPVVSVPPIAARIPLVLKKLSEAAKTDLQVSPVLADEVVLLSVREQRLSEIMDRLARVTAAEWVRESASYRLSRPARKVQEIEKARQAFRLGQIEQTFGEQAAKLSDQGQFTERAAMDLAYELNAMLAREDEQRDSRAIIARRDAYRRGPTTRALIRMLPLLDRRLLVDLKPEECIVFSSRPTKMQVQLPAAAVRVVEQLAIEQDQWAKAIELVDGRMSSGPARRTSDTIGDPLRFRQKVDPKMPVLVKVSGIGANPDFVLELFLGQSSAAQAMLILNDHAFLPNSEPPVTREPIPVSPRAATFARLLTRGGQERLDPEWQAVLSDPTTHEPLAFEISEVVQGLANQRRASIVAYLSDSALSGQADGEGRIPPAFVDRLFSDFTNMRWSHEGAWFVVEPRRPWDLAKLRAQRTAMTSFFRSLRCGGSVLSAVVSYLGTREALGSLEWRIIWQLFDHAPAIRELATDDAMVFASLTLFQRERLLAGEKLEYASLGPLTRERIQRNVFKRGESKLFVERQAMEPTMALPEGIPPSAYLELSANREVALVRSLRTGSISLTEFVAQVLSAERSGTPVSAQLKEGTYLACERLNYVLTLRTPGGLATAWSASDFSFPEGTRARAFSELSAPFQRLFEDERKRMGGSR